MGNFIGEIRMFAGNFPPLGWELCNGQILAIADNDILFNVIGTTYGGNGINTFALPNMQGNVPVHAGQGPGLSLYDVGQTDGADTVTLAVTQIPSHTHTLGAQNVP